MLHKKLFCFLLLYPFIIKAQMVQFPQKEIDRCLQEAWKASAYSSVPGKNKPSEEIQSGVYQFLKSYVQEDIVIPRVPEHITRGSDTLYVGITPKDTITVTGVWQHNGPIFILNDGVLIFKNAQATILGNIYIINEGQFLAEHTDFNIPQQYFYQRSIMAAHHSKMSLQNCSMRFSGMSHNLVILDSATVSFKNVHFSDWTTTGVFGKPQFIIDTCNNIGEIIMMDRSAVTVKNTDTVLLWHHIPGGAQLNWEFPEGNQLSHYSLSPVSQGVSGINYSVEADNCKLIWWGLMPEDGSDVTVSNSYLRAIGAWFTNKDSTTVTGLANNAHYVSSGNLFKDRILQLDNSTVVTWSLYPMDSSVVNVKSCIAGEIGSGGYAKTTCTSAFVDGSGGYFWGSGSAVQFAVLSAFTSPVRSEGSAMVLAGYSSIANGVASGVGNSILFLVQTPVLQQPVAYEGAVVWTANLAAPSIAHVNDSVTVTGSAYILRGPESVLMHFDHYYLKYQPAGSTDWIQLSGVVKTPVNQNTLAKWNTKNLVPGDYHLMLVLKDDWGDSVSANISVTLLPAVATGGISPSAGNQIFVSPNPVSDNLTVTVPAGEWSSMILTDITGRNIAEKRVTEYKPEEIISMKNIPPGIYFLNIQSAKSSIIKKIVKQ